jgi:hypothetical protein
MKKQKLRTFLLGVGKYLDDILVVIGLGFLAAAGFEIHPVVGLAVLGVGCIGYGIFVSLGRG